MDIAKWKKKKTEESVAFYYTIGLNILVKQLHIEAEKLN